VARAIYARLAATGRRAVGLDMREVDPARFPNVVNTLRQAGIEPTRELVPVAPAAHYLMGGVATGLVGGSTVSRLFAVGECACTGLHGANRLASNSLTECFVFGRRAALAALDCPPPGTPAERPPAELTAPAPSPQTRQAMWECAGLERDAAGLRRLAGEEHPLARMVALCALARTESRGAHWRADHPDRDPGLDHHHSVIGGEEDPRFELWE
jgi:L-aspartate oxidase